MTSSTLHDLTRIAALPGTAGAGSVARLEAPQKPLRAEIDPKVRSVMPKGRKKAPEPDPATVRERAYAALDTAENHLDERPTFFARVMRGFVWPAFMAPKVEKMPERPEAVLSFYAGPEANEGDRCTIGTTEFEMRGGVFYAVGGTIAPAKPRKGEQMVSSGALYEFNGYDWIAIGVIASPIERVITGKHATGCIVDELTAAGLVGPKGKPGLIGPRGPRGAAR